MQFIIQPSRSCLNYLRILLYILKTCFLLMDALLAYGRTDHTTAFSVSVDFVSGMHCVFCTVLCMCATWSSVSQLDRQYVRL